MANAMQHEVIKMTRGGDILRSLDIHLPGEKINATGANRMILINIWDGGSFLVPATEMRASEVG